MIGGSLQEAISKLASMPAQQVFMLTKDPGIGYLAATELRERNMKRAQMQPTQAPPPTTVVDQEAQKAMQADVGIMSGIPQVPTQRMATGGLVSFSGGGPTEMELRALAQKIATEENVPYSIAMRRAIFRTKGAPDLPPSGATQLMDIFRRSMAENATTRTYPDESMRGSRVVPEPAVSDTYPDVRGSMTLPPIASGTTKVPPPPPPPQDKLPPGRGGGIGGGVGAGVTGIGGLPAVIQPSTYITPQMEQDVMAGKDAALKMYEDNRYKAPTKEAERADYADQIAWLNQMNPQDPDVIEAKARLRKRLAEIENGGEQKNRRQGWIEAGLGMLASTSPHALVGVGEGGLKGTRVYRDLQQQDANRIDQLSKEQMAAGLAEQARKAGLMNTGIQMAQNRWGREDTERQGLQALADKKSAHAGLPIELATKRAESDLKGRQGAHYANNDLFMPERIKTDRMELAARERIAAAAANRHSSALRNDTSYREYTTAIAKGHDFIRQMQPKIDTERQLLGVQIAKGDRTAAAKLAALEKGIRIKALEVSRSHTMDPDARKQIDADIAELRGETGGKDEDGFSRPKNLRAVVPGAK